MEQTVHNAYRHPDAPGFCLVDYGDSVELTGPGEYNSPKQKFDVSRFVVLGWIASSVGADETVALARGTRRVATPEGVAKYGEPIGTPITRDMKLKTARRGKATQIGTKPGRHRQQAAKPIRHPTPAGASEIGSNAKVPGARLLRYRDGTIAVQHPSGKVSPKQKVDLEEFKKLGWDVKSSKLATAPKSKDDKRKQEGTAKEVSTGARPQRTQPGELAKEATSTGKADEPAPEEPEKDPDLTTPEGAREAERGEAVNPLDTTGDRAFVMRTAFDAGYTVEHEFHGGNIADSVELVRLSDGSRAVLKQATEADTRREVLAARVANAVGVEDLVAVQIGENKVLMSHQEGQIGLRYSTEAVAQRRRDAQRQNQAFDQFAASDIVHDELVQKEGAKEIGLLDWLIMNHDRHDENFIVLASGRVVPIDHGNAEFSLDEVYGSAFGPANGEFTTYWLAPETEGYKKDFDTISPKFTKAELKAIRKRIESISDDFSGKDERAWYAFVLSQLARVEEKAK